MKRLATILAVCLVFWGVGIKTALADNPTTNPTSINLNPSCGLVGQEVVFTINVNAENANGQDIYYKYFVNMGRYCTSDESSDPEQWLMLKNWTTETTFQTEPLTFSKEGKNIFIVWAATPEEDSSVLNPSSLDPPDFCSAMIGQYFNVTNGGCGQEENEIKIAGSGKVKEPVTITSLPNSGNLWYQFWVNTRSYENRSATPNWSLIKPADLSTWTQENFATWTPESEGLYTFVVWSTTDPSLSCKGMAGSSYRVTKKEPNPWPMTGHDAQRTGRSSYQGVSQLSDQPLNLAWKIEGGNPLRNQVIAADGTLYAILQSSEIVNVHGDLQDYLYGFNPQGEIIYQQALHWSCRNLCVGIRSELYIGSGWYGVGVKKVDGTIEPVYEDSSAEEIIQALDGTLFIAGNIPSLDSDGIVAIDPYSKQEKWKFLPEEDVNWGSLRISLDPNGNIYLAFSSGTGDEQKDTLWALSPDGTLKWELPEKWVHLNYASPVIGIGPDGKETIYLKTAKEYEIVPSHFEDFAELWAIDAENGNIKWRYQPRSLILSDPAIGKDGTIYMAKFGPSGWEPCDDGWCKFKTVLVAVDPFHGTAKWEFRDEFHTPITYSTDAPPSISSDGTIFISSDNALYAVNPNGSLKQKFEIPMEDLGDWFGGCWSSPVIDDARGMVYAVGRYAKGSFPNVEFTYYLHAFEENE